MNNESFEIINKIVCCRVSKSSTLQSYAKKTFLAVGGIESWTRNPNLVPNKLKRITPLMEILWRFPWKVSQHQLKVFCYGTTIENLKMFHIFISQGSLCGWLDCIRAY